MKVFSNKKFLHIIAVIVMVLLFITSLFYIKTKEMLENNVMRELLSSIKSQTVSITTNMNATLNIMETYAESWRNDNFTIEQLEEYHRTTTLSLGQSHDMGVLTIDGTAVFGRDFTKQEYSTLDEVKRGKSIITFVGEYMGTNQDCVMFAVPIYNNDNIKYIFYEIKTLKQMRKLNQFSEENGSVYFVVDSKGNLVIPSNDTMTTGANYTDYIKESIDQAEQQRVEKDIKKQLYYSNYGVGEVEKGSNIYYMSVLRIYGTDFYTISFVNKEVKGNYINGIIQLFALVVSSLVILFTFVMVYIEVSANGAKAKMFKLAYMDELTNLHNWSWFTDRVNSGQIKLDDKILAIFNIKGLKTINLLYGRENGDALLKSIAQVLSQLDWPQTVVRCDNDNFVILSGNMDKACFEKKMNRFFLEVNHIPSVKSKRIYYRCGAMYIDSVSEGIEYNKLLDNCRNACNNAKAFRRSEIFYFDKEVKIENDRIQSYKRELHSALEKNEFEVFFQPKYEIKNGVLVGAEALVRWNYQMKQYISPNLFIPCFEADGTVKHIDQFVFRTVCKQLAYWSANNMPLHTISVNISRIQLDNDSIVEELTSIAKEYGVPLEYIQIEITESANVENLHQLNSKMMEIKKAGFELALDDFGTGYATFSMLKDMPLDVLKIDKSFIDGMDSEKGRWIVKDIVAIAHHLNVKSVAEGVENEKQRDLLLEYGCDYIQGYFYGRPMPVSEYEKLL